VGAARPIHLMSGAPIRVLLAKPGLDGHERGAKVVAFALRDAGIEVIYSGIRQSPEMIVAAAVEEDVDCIGLSILSGTHKEHCASVMTLLKERNAADIPVVLGGIIPDVDIPALREMGVAGIFGPGSSTTAIVIAIRRIVDQRRAGVA
jgi:methylmalonyl-CoA mutase C-terminal domain/subunit